MATALLAPLAMEVGKSLIPKAAEAAGGGIGKLIGGKKGAKIGRSVGRAVGKVGRVFGFETGGMVGTGSATRSRMRPFRAV